MFIATLKKVVLETKVGYIFQYISSIHEYKLDYLYFKISLV